MSLSLLRQHRQPIWWDSAGTWGPEPGQGWVPKRPLSPLVDSRLAPVEVLACITVMIGEKLAHHSNRAQNVMTSKHDEK